MTLRQVFLIRNNPNTQKVFQILGKKSRRSRIETTIITSPDKGTRSSQLGRKPSTTTSLHTKLCANTILGDKSFSKIGSANENLGSKPISPRMIYTIGHKKRELERERVGFRACALVIARDRDCPSLGEAEKGEKGIRRSFHGSK